MKATGIVRRTDDLGRLVIPKEIRNKLGFQTGDPFEIYVNQKEKAVMFKKYDLGEEYDKEAIARMLNALFGKSIKWAVFMRQELLTTNDMRFPDDLDVVSPEYERVEFNIDGDEVVIVTSLPTEQIVTAKTILKAFMTNDD